MRRSRRASPAPQTARPLERAHDQFQCRLARLTNQNTCTCNNHLGALAAVHYGPQADFLRSSTRGLTFERRNATRLHSWTLDSPCCARPRCRCSRQEDRQTESTHLIQPYKDLYLRQSLLVNNRLLVKMLCLMLRSSHLFLAVHYGSHSNVAFGSDKIENRVKTQNRPAERHITMAWILCVSACH